MVQTMMATALSSLRPPPRLKLSDFIEQEMELPDDVAALPGKIRLYPFQRGIADAISDPLLTRVTVLKSARIGYTTLLTAAVANHVVNDPAPILAVLPTEDDAKRFVVSDLEPIFAASPALAGSISADQKEGKRSTMLSRRFAGGSLKVVASKAPRNLRAHNTRILILDEVDEMTNGAQGSPIVLAEKRTTSFPDRKIIMGSTPVYEETSNVIKSYAKSDKRIFEVCCPECEEFREIVWKDIQWPPGEPLKAYWCAPCCGSVVEESKKTAMVENGRWRATAPEVIGHAGFKVNALVSPLTNASWGQLATEFVAAKDIAEDLQVFVNTVLGEGWRGTGEEIDDEELAKRSERFGMDLLPADVLAITAGVDVQRKDRLEVTFIGWDRAGNAYVLGHRVIWGQPSDDQTWRELDEMLKLRFPHPFGGSLGIDGTAIDSGDGETMEFVYKFAFPRFNRKVVAIKGVGGKRPPIERSSQKIKGGTLWIVGIDGIKSHLAGRLTRGNSIRFSDELPAVWYEQLTAERAIVRYSRGQPQRRFERIPGRDAEGLDCTVYAFAVRNIININWDSREEQLRNPELANPAPAKKQRSGPSFMERIAG